MIIAQSDCNDTLFEKLFELSCILDEKLFVNLQPLTNVNLRAENS